MSYDSFLDTILSDLRNALGEDYQLHVKTLSKNNNTLADGLFLSKTGETATPVIYLNDYYSQVMSGTITMEEAVADILRLHHGTHPPSSAVSDILSDFDRTRDRIMFRLIHTDSNPAILSDVPSIPFLDLSIVFYLFLERNGDRQMTALIHNAHMTRWGIDTKNLWELARVNTPRAYPACVTPMTDILQQLSIQATGQHAAREKIYVTDTRSKSVPDTCKETTRSAPYGTAEADRAIAALDESEAPPLYVLTNERSIYGSACILYPGVLQRLSDQLNTDLVLLPSSIHEFLILPGEPDTPYEQLSEMVTTINRQQVDREEQLSNQVYLYRRTDGLIRIMSHGPNLAG